VDAPRFAVYGRPAPLPFTDGYRGRRSALSVGDGHALLVVMGALGRKGLDPELCLPRSFLVVDGQEVGADSVSGCSDGLLTRTVEVLPLPRCLPEHVTAVVRGLDGAEHAERLPRL
jgi:hypothetical protein